ncbi:MAG: protein kinase [Rhodospirillaceae bacterium]|nr:protein kinase [Rhodospirillaceae bacterium]
MSGSHSASSEHRSALPEGTRLHNYALVRVLGAGGFGITYMAREEVTERAVAIKEYLPSSLAVRERDGMTVHPVSESTRNDYEWGLSRFRQEAKVLLSLRHHNIVPSLNYFEANGTAYLVMEYQEGQTLAQLTAGGTALEESEVRDFIFPLLDGVEYVHKNGLLHRDIKPDNIFIRLDGTPVLIDFGSARQALGHHSHSLTAVVTDGYAPFEQYERQGDQGPWTDIYALGAVLFRCLVGHRPPTATKRLSTFFRGAPDPAAPGFETIRQRCSRPLAAAIEAALAVNGEDRPQTIADLRAMIADTGARATVRRPEMANPTLFAGAPGTRAAAARTANLGAAPAGPDRPSAEPPRRRRRLLPLYAGAAVLLLAGTAGAAYFGVGGIDIPGFTKMSTEAREAEEAKRKAAEEAARRKAEEEEAAKRRAEEEAAKRKADEEAAKRRAEEEAAKRKAEEEAAKRKAEEDAARKADEERRKAEKEAQRRRAEAEEKARRDQEAKRKAEEEAKRRAGRRAARWSRAPLRRGRPRNPAVASGPQPSRNRSSGRRQAGHGPAGFVAALRARGAHPHHVSPDQGRGAVGQHHFRGRRRALGRRRSVGDRRLRQLGSDDAATRRGAGGL